MLTEDAFFQLVREIEFQGYPEQTAARFAALIGDRPIRDEAGHLLVIDEAGQELARLAWPRFLGR